MSALALQSFIYEAEPIRVVTLDEKPWWVAADVAKQLGYNHVPSMVRMLGDQQKGVHKVHTLGGEQSLTVISEGGLFKCILRSKRPEAERFGDWVTDDLLPTLRLTGRYEIANDEPAFEPPEMPDEIEALRTKLAIAREARIVFGLKAARKAWRVIGLLPELTDSIGDGSKPELLAIGTVAQLHRSIADWLDARTEAVAGHRVASQALYDDYLTWAKVEEIPPVEIVSMTAFGRSLSNCGIGTIKSDRMYRVGLRLVD